MLRLRLRATRNKLGICCFFYKLLFAFLLIHTNVLAERNETGNNGELLAIVNSVGTCENDKGKREWRDSFEERAEIGKRLTEGLL